MSKFIRQRRQLRSQIRTNSKLDQRLHLFASLMLVLNMVLILYAVFSITIRMTLSGVALLDSLPVAFYILPLMIILPLLAKSYYTDRFAPFNFVILSMSSVIFGILSVLVRLFILFSVLNILALIIIFVMGRFRPETSLRKIGPKGFALFIGFNILGLMFPITTIAMGANPIAVNPAAIPDSIGLSVPLADFEFPFVNITPHTSLIQQLVEQNCSLDFRVLEGNSDSLQRLRNWLTHINSTSIEYGITLTAPRESFLQVNYTIGTGLILGATYASHAASLVTIVDELDSLNMTHMPNHILYDMTLSDIEWRALMGAARSIDLVSFGSLVRNLVDTVNPATLDAASFFLANATRAAGIECGILVESFVLDDIQDSDTLAMRACGITAGSLSFWDYIEVSCSRTAFSLEMEGDVGEYLVYSFSRSLLAGSSALAFNPKWSLRLGMIGNGTDLRGRQNPVYGNIESIATDIGNAGAAVDKITIESLPAIIVSYGEAGIAELRAELETLDSVAVTYTFRIYAFRAVFIAIDSFDPLML